MTRGVCVVCGGALPARLRHPHQITCGPRCRDERKRRLAAAAQARWRERQMLATVCNGTGDAMCDLTETHVRSAGLAALNDLPASAVAVTVTARRQDGSTVTGTVTQRDLEIDYREDQLWEELMDAAKYRAEARAAGDDAAYAAADAEVAARGERHREYCAAHGLLADDAATDGEDARLAALAGGAPAAD